jgi:hypothetical protein
MASTIKLKNGSGAPTTGDLVQGEPALDLTNKRLYTENASGVVIEVGTNPSTIDINAGTIDGTVIGGSTAAAITGTTITGTSFVSSGDMTFGDNDKAIFGAGSDLKLYHTGSHSYIDENGTGNLYIGSNNGAGVYIQGSGETLASFVDDGAVTLYHDNAAKLATTSTGIDVTGTVTADGLTVDGSLGSFAVQASGAELHFSRNDNNDILANGGTSASFTIGANNNLTLKTGATLTQRLQIANNGDISFYEDTGTTAKFFWDASAESLGIGTSSPSTKLHLGGTAPLDSIIRQDSTASGTNWEIGEREAGKWQIWEDDSDSVVATFMSSGNVGIGISSPATLLDIKEGTAATDAIIGLTAGTGGRAQIRSEAQADNTSSELSFHTMGGSSTSERLRIDSSGNLLVGKSATAFGTAGVEASASNGLWSTRSGLPALALNRLSTDGSIADFYQDGTVVGSIGTDASRFKVKSNSIALYLENESNKQLVWGNVSGVPYFYPQSDNDTNIGYPTQRFKDLYLSGGVYLGGTGAANLLDDYETGNFDPDVTTANSDMSGITYVSQLGSYVKVGDLVWFRLQVGFSATTIGTGNFRITNLPFVSKNDAEARQSAQVLTYNLTWDSTWQQIATEGVQNSSFIDFLISRSGSTWVNLKATDMSNSTTYYYIVSGCYVTN